MDLTICGSLSFVWCWYAYSVSAKIAKKKLIHCELGNKKQAQSPTRVVCLTVKEKVDILLLLSVDTDQKSIIISDVSFGYQNINPSHDFQLDSFPEVADSITSFTEDIDLYLKSKYNILTNLSYFGSFKIQTISLFQKQIYLFGKKYGTQFEYYKMGLDVEKLVNDYYNEKYFYDQIIFSIGILVHFWSLCACHKRMTK
jgi:hypothetical protein